MMITPNLNVLLYAALTTIKISIIAGLIGSMGGLAMGIVTSNQLKVSVIAPVIKGYITIIRGTPVFIQLLLVYFGLPAVTGIDLTPFMAGVATLGCNATAYMAEIIRGGINALSTAQWEASYALGYNPGQTLRYIILPQVLQNVSPAITNEFIAIVKQSSMLMILGVPELTKVSKDIVSRELRPFEIYLCTALIYFCITTVVSMLAANLEQESK